MYSSAIAVTMRLLHEVAAVITTIALHFISVHYYIWCIVMVLNVSSVTALGTSHLHHRQQNVAFESIHIKSAQQHT